MFHDPFHRFGYLFRGIFRYRKTGRRDAWIEPRIEKEIREAALFRRDDRYSGGERFHERRAEPFGPGGTDEDVAGFQIFRKLGMRHVSFEDRARFDAAFFRECAKRSLIRTRPKDEELDGFGQ